MNNFLLVEQKTKNTRIPISDILYVKSVPNGSHQIEIVTINEKFTIYGTLSDISQRHKEFIRSHRTYLVNFMNVKEINKSQKKILFSKNDKNETCPISRRQYRDVINSFI